jgi:hypothetical protein
MVTPGLYGVPEVAGAVACDDREEKTLSKTDNTAAIVI